ncbi:MAG: hypothetical protein RLZZ09_373 [Pseudomonadota bacterium]
MESKYQRVMNMRRIVMILPVVMFLLFVFFVVNPATSGL